jgi:septum formation protein
VTPVPPRLILASGSPRRADILGRLGLDFEVRVPRIDERLHPGESPADAAERLAREKAAAGAEADALALGCDTLVAHAGEALGKPGSGEEAVAMIERLGGDEHVVYTGIALAGPGRVVSAVESTVVRFRPLTRRECEEYVGTGEPMDKAGAYGIQGFGAALVEGIEGDYFNVMGMPVGRLLELLRRFGWRYAFGRLEHAMTSADD